MRVIAGTAKGRRLAAPRGDRTRPTADRVKEALFSSLQRRLPDVSAVDLYAGSGALGIEALSRGADHVTFVERLPRALESLYHNLEITNIVDRADVVERDVTAAVASPLPGQPFGLALLDPPYGIDAEELAAVLAGLMERLEPSALVSVELGVHSAAPVWPSGARLVRQRRYGDTVLYFGALEADHERTNG